MSMRAQLSWRPSLLAVGLALLSGALPVGAQEKKADAGPMLDEIVVVSQKRAGAVDVQAVSVAITAFDANAIEKSFATDLVDVGRMAPNIQLNQSGTFGGFSNFFIRGIGSSNTIRTVDPAVGTFVDGIYIGFGPASMQDTFDIASVEVLRGPQGTLFGKNVTGGAVSVLSTRPTGELGADIKVTYGNYDRMDVSAAVQFPIIEGELAGKIAAMSKSRDGYFKNLTTGRTKPDVDTSILRPTFRWTPNEVLTVDLIGEYYRDKGGSSASQNRDSRVNPRMLLVNGQLVASPATVQRVFGYTPPTDKYDINHNDQGYVDTSAGHGIIDASLDLGHGIVSLVTGYREVKFNSSTDFDGSPYVVFEFPDNRERQHQYSGELRYASNFSDTVEFTAGLYYFTQEMYIAERRAAYASGPATAPVISRTVGIAKTDDSSYAVFGQGSVKFTDQLSLILGGRYTVEKKEIELCPFNAALYTSLNFEACPVTRLNGDDKWNSFSPKIGLDYKVDDDVLLYASWTKGFRSGSFNARATNAAVLGPVDQETVSSYEAGMKSELMGRRLRLNTAAFLSDYTNIQRTVSDTVIVNGLPTVTQVPRNAASATIWGLELEGSFLVTDALTLDASLGYTNAGYDSFANIDTNRNGVYEPAIDGPIAKDLKFERVPKWQYAVSASYEVPVSDTSSLRFRTSYTWVDDQFIDTLNSPSLALGSYGLWDASVSYSLNDSYTVSLFGRNLNDAEYYDFGFDGGTHRAVWGGTPRTYGVELSAKF
ncbi:TonB-dependent receptor [Niveispirillum cyanobacteriorum]|uniref:Uncharacterized protein n=1 Tax=Niveispirillum cyanobacteriorum TaxID=1612173 RepID=A0A2K9NEK0_9PROT|nr:TonB-dependent receptor [Niveispirillum cyanobacteriorum]AUN31509.1 hypothetical protein C0V82_15630 [Niveispirillum cyanobacteriorum]GGE70551.1 TonB-dependent receptor [Niveispirillum cyanobacteriorum]